MLKLTPHSACSEIANTIRMVKHSSGGDTFSNLMKPNPNEDVLQAPMEELENETRKELVSSKLIHTEHAEYGVEHMSGLLTEQYLENVQRLGKVAHKVTLVAEVTTSLTGLNSDFISDLNLDQVDMLPAWMPSIHMPDSLQDSGANESNITIVKGQDLVVDFDISAHTRSGLMVAAGSTPGSENIATEIIVSLGNFALGKLSQRFIEFTGVSGKETTFQNMEGQSSLFANVLHNKYQALANDKVIAVERYNQNSLLSNGTDKNVNRSSYKPARVSVTVQLPTAENNQPWQEAMAFVRKENGAVTLYYRNYFASDDKAREQAEQYKALLEKFETVKQVKVNGITIYQRSQESQ